MAPGRPTPGIPYYLGDVEDTPAPRLWRHALAIGLLPCVVTLVVPTLLVWERPGTLHVGWCLPSPWNTLPVLLAVALAAAGLTLMARTIALLHAVGRGTLAPWDPTRRLVVRGVYRHVRNPMISGVSCLLLAEACLLGSLPLLVWFACFVTLNAVYIPLVEERSLEQRFGDAYRTYKRHVPRWIPRRRAWPGTGP